MAAPPKTYTVESLVESDHYALEARLNAITQAGGTIEFILPCTTIKPDDQGYFHLMIVSSTTP